MPPDEVYEYYLWTGGFGKTSVKLILHGDGSAEIMFVQHSEHTYSLHGRYERWSEGYGWVRISHVEHTYKPVFPPETEATTTDVHIEVFEVELIYEYVKLTATPFYHHPQDALTEMRDLGYAGWNESFDLLLMPTPFMYEVLEATQYQLEEGTPSGTPPPDYLPYLTAETVSQLHDLVYELDHIKLARISS